MTHEQAEELWIAANCHAINILGEFLSSEQVDEVTGIPPMPGDVDEVLEKVIDYLKNST